MTTRIISPESLITCMLCGHEYEMLTPSHLRHAHNITLADYCIQFPNAPTITANKDAEIRRKISEKTKGRQPHNKGIPATETQKLKQSEIMKQKYSTGEIVHWNQGNVLTDAVKNKISSSLIGKKRPDDVRELANSKRRSTYAKKKNDGWVSPLSGRKLAADHYRKTLDSQRKAVRIRTDRMWEDVSNKCVEYNLSIISKSDTGYVGLLCNECNAEFTFHNQIFRNSKTIGEKICPTCYPRLSGTSKGETELADYIASIYSGKIIRNDRSRLEFGMELDIYLPDESLAFEYNGLYWHSENVHGLKRNLKHKTTKAKSLGIRVIHVMEDEWLYRPDIVKSRIRQILKIRSKFKCHARQTTISLISSSEKDTFLKDNHIQGTDISSVRLGAFYNGELLAVMTFKPTNYTKGGDGSGIELSRFSVKTDWHIPGIASKLFSFYVKNFNPDSIISYADNRWSLGNLYSVLGFTNTGISPPNYWYFLPNELIRWHRSRFMKHTLEESYTSPELTEFQIMENRGYYKIYDCGTSKWEWKTV